MKTYEEKEAIKKADKRMKAKVFWLGAVFGATLLFALLLINRV